MTDPTEAIRDAREQITSALAHLGFSDDSVRAPLHKAARNLSYALKAMTATGEPYDPEPILCALSMQTRGMYDAGGKVSV